MIVVELNLGLTQKQEEAFWSLQHKKSALVDDFGELEFQAAQ